MLIVHHATLEATAPKTLRTVVAKTPVRQRIRSGRREVPGPVSVTKAQQFRKLFGDPEPERTPAPGDFRTLYLAVRCDTCA